MNEQPTGTRHQLRGVLMLHGWAVEPAMGLHDSEHAIELAALIEAAFDVLVLPEELIGSLTDVDAVAKAVDLARGAGASSTGASLVMAGEEAWGDW